ncbi:MAG TPA: MFS transporter [Burkholderiales bacterium]|nr:MFS transporter [Burkholderiales bacterium]
MSLRPDAVVTAADIERGKRALVQDAAWASVCGALYGGVVLAGFAVALDAGALVIGLLASIPFAAQAVQLPSIALIERVRERRRITVAAATVARGLIFGLAIVPWIAAPGRLPLLVSAQLLITVLGSVAGCSFNSWLHQLLPREGLGQFFARRLFFATSLACIGSLAAGLIVDHWPWGEHLRAYSLTFALAGIAGFVSSWFLTRVPEPVMASAGPHESVLAKMRSPFVDRNFRRVLVFMGAWNFASNLSAPFLTVYLMRQLGYSLSTVTTLWVASQVANALTLYLWGRLSDRLTNKAVLAAALPVYFGCVLGLVFAALPAHRELTLVLLYVVHIVMGAAAGGIALAAGNIGLKLAPQGQGTAYLAAISLVASVSGGLAPILGGALAQWFEAAHLELLVRWGSAARTGEFRVVAFAHWEFLFAVSAALGLYAAHALSRVSEGEEHSERVVMQQFALEAMRTVNQISSIGGLLGNLSAFGRLLERRLVSKRRPGEPERRTGTGG